MSELTNLVINAKQDKLSSVPKLPGTGQWSRRSRKFSPEAIITNYGSYYGSFLLYQRIEEI
jgi:hypothetical protein